jgi:hypothetical protein
MSPDMQIVLSGALTFGVPLLFAAYELRAMRRPSSRPDDGRDPPNPAGPPPPPRDAPALRPLPACLIPNLPPRLTARLASREMERV